jgi:hypothetical protein
MTVLSIKMLEGTAEYSAACRSTLVLGGECNQTSVGVGTSVKIPLQQFGGYEPEYNCTVPRNSGCVGLCGLANNEFKYILIILKLNCVIWQATNRQTQKMQQTQTQAQNTHTRINTDNHAHFYMHASNDTCKQTHTYSHPLSHTQNHTHKRTHTHKYTCAHLCKLL